MERAELKYDNFHAKEVTRMFDVAGREPKNDAQLDAIIDWLRSNIPEKKVRHFCNVYLKDNTVITIKHMQELFNNDQFYHEKRDAKKRPSQDDPVETWCRMCMNNGIVRRYEIHDDGGYDIAYRCSCEAGDGFAFLPHYTDHYPDDPQFAYDPAKEFYWEVYNRESKKIYNLPKVTHKPKMYNDVIREQVKQRNDLPF